MHGQLEDAFDLQDRISASFVVAIAPQIRSAEIKRSLRRPPDNLDAYDMFLRGQNALHQGNIQGGDDWLAKSIELAPAYAKPMAMRAWLGTLSQLSVAQFAGHEARERYIEMANRALRIALDDPKVLAYAAYTIDLFEGD